jgi:hypothetical protein
VDVNITNVVLGNVTPYGLIDGSHSLKRVKLLNRPKNGLLINRYTLSTVSDNGKRIRLSAEWFNLQATVK